MGRNKKKKHQHQRNQQTAQQKRQRLSKRQIKAQKNRQNKKKWRDNLIQFTTQLQKQGLEIKQVGDDGNCLFRAIADQLDGAQYKHAIYRAEACQYMMANQDNFKPFIQDDQQFDQYIDDMQKDGVWGGNLEIQALSLIYRFNVFIHQLDQASFIIKNFFEPQVPTIHLSYHLGEHYNSVRVKGDIDFQGILMKQIKTNGHQNHHNHNHFEEQKKIEQQQKQLPPAKKQLHDNKKQPAPRKKQKGKKLLQQQEQNKLTIQQCINSLFQVHNQHALQAAILSMFGTTIPENQLIISRAKQLQARYCAIQAGIISQMFKVSYSQEENGIFERNRLGNGNVKKKLMQQLRKGMQILDCKTNDWISIGTTVNKKCLCGSGLKFKMCCLEEDLEILEAIVVTAPIKKTVDVSHNNHDGDGDVGELNKQFEALYI